MEEQGLNSGGDDSNEYYMSFTDIAMLLLVFFIYLYSISSINQSTIEQASNMIKESLGFEDNTQTTIEEVESSTVYTENMPKKTDLDNEMMISLNQDVLFVPGSATIKPAGKIYLEKLAEILSFQNVLIIIEGHTDSDPINTYTFPSNWHLSAVRSSAVCKIFEESGIPSSRLKAVGYGQSRPLVENTDSASKKKNRRVEIYLKPIEEGFE